MLTLTLAIALATTPTSGLPTPPSAPVTSETDDPTMLPPLLEAPPSPRKQRGGRAARLLDVGTLAKLDELDARAAALGPSSAELTLRTVAIVGAVIVAVPLTAMAAALVVGAAVGAASAGFFGFLVGLFAGPIFVVTLIPVPVWAIVGVVALVAGGSLAAERLVGSERRAALAELSRERKALLRGAPRAELAPVPMTLATIATF